MAFWHRQPPAPPAAQPQEPGWRDTPALQRLVTSTPPVADRDRFVASLASHHNPSLLAPLAHAIDPAAAGGLIDGIVRPTAPAPAAVQRATASPGTVKRFNWFPRVPPRITATPPVQRQAERADDLPRDDRAELPSPADAAEDAPDVAAARGASESEAPGGTVVPGPSASAPTTHAPEVQRLVADPAEAPLLDAAPDDAPLLDAPRPDAPPATDAAPQQAASDGPVAPTPLAQRPEPVPLHPTVQPTTTTPSAPPAPASLLEVSRAAAPTEHKPPAAAAGRPAQTPRAADELPGPVPSALPARSCADTPRITGASAQDRRGQSGDVAQRDAPPRESRPLTAQRSSPAVSAPLPRPVYAPTPLPVQRLAHPVERRLTPAAPSAPAPSPVPAVPQLVAQRTLPALPAPPADPADPAAETAAVSIGYDPIAPPAAEVEPSIGQPPPTPHRHDAHDVAPVQRSARDVPTLAPPALPSTWARPAEPVTARIRASGPDQESLPPFGPVQRAATEPHAAATLGRPGFGAPLAARPETATPPADRPLTVEGWASLRTSDVPLQRYVSFVPPRRAPDVASRPGSGGFGAPLARLPATAGAPIRQLQRAADESHTPETPNGPDEPPAAADAGDVAVAAGIAQRTVDGSVHFGADPQPVQRAESPAPATTSGAPGAALPGGGNIDDLVRRLYDPLAARLRAELRLDRERAGIVTDLRR